ncbi:MAG: tetratricopeptide repeat protein [Candidatus Kapaibacterium sp.]
MEISPLFAIDAQKLLGAGDASGAVQLLEQGIEVFPEYTTAYAVMARAFMQMRDAESAYEWVKRGLKQAPTHRALVILEQELRRQTFSGTTTESNSVQQDPVEDSVAEHSHEPPHEPSHEAPPPSVPEEPIAHTPSAPPNLQAHYPEANEHEVLLDEALSNVDDDNNDWNKATELVDEHHVDVPEPETESETEPETEPETTQPAAESKPSMQSAADTLTDDALSNVDDDNDEWSEVRAEAEQAAEEQAAEVELPDEEEAAVVEDVAQDRLDAAGDDEIAHHSGDSRHAHAAGISTEEVLQKINVVGGNVVVDKVIMRDLMERMELQGLRLISSPSAGSRRTFRSSAMRLIPGLEFTPLRVQSSPKARRSTSHLPELPPFPVIRGSEMNVSPALAPSAPAKASKKSSRADRSSRSGDAPKTQLEELALRLEKVRTPITEEPDGVTPRGVSEGVEPTLVTETMAKIYAQQGLTDQAIKAYRQLARSKPERREEFEQRIDELQRTTDNKE